MSNIHKSFLRHSKRLDYNFDFSSLYPTSVKTYNITSDSKEFVIKWRQKRLRNKKINRIFDGK